MQHEIKNTQTIRDFFVLSDGVYYKEDFSGTKNLEDAAQFETMIELVEFVKKSNIEDFTSFSVLHCRESLVPKLQVVGKI